MAARAPSRRATRPSLVAAALVAASVIAFVVGREQESNDRVARSKARRTGNARDFRTARGQRAVVVLGDGSRVELGAESELRVRESGAGRRIVSLDGQAVFDVVHDSLRPFEVQSANAITEDLGTRFTVRAYRGEARVQVFVASGKVALRAVGSPASSGTLLGPNDLGVLDSVGRTTVRNGVDSTSHLAWTRDRFVFDNALLADVLSDISRWFDVKIEVAEPGAAEASHHHERSRPLVVRSHCRCRHHASQTAIHKTWIDDRDSVASFFICPFSFRTRFTSRFHQSQTDDPKQRSD